MPIPKRDAGNTPADLDSAEELPPPGGSPKTGEVVTEAEAPELESLGDLLGAAFDTMLARAEKREVPVPVPWEGVAAELGGGLWPGLYVLVGPPKAGKSQWAMQIALHAAQQGAPVLYVALELGRVDLAARFAGLLTKRKWSRLYLGTDRGEVEMVGGKARRELGKLPIRVAFAPPYGFNPASLDVLARKLVEAHPRTEGAPPPLVVLDFLQLVSGGEERELRQRIQRATYAARAIARELGIAVLLVSATAREHYAALGVGEGRKGESHTPLGRGDPGRLMGTGKESGEVEFSADAVLVLGRGRKHEVVKNPERSVRAVVVWLAVAAIRAQSDAAAGWRRLLFNGGWFTEPTKDEIDELLAADNKAADNKDEEKELRAAERAAKAAERAPAKAPAKAAAAENTPRSRRGD